MCALSALSVWSTSALKQAADPLLPDAGVRERRCVCSVPGEPLSSEPLCRGCITTACCSTALECDKYFWRLLPGVEGVCSAETVHTSLQVKDNESLYPAFYKLTDSRSQITSCAFRFSWSTVCSRAVHCMSMAPCAVWP